MSNVNCVRCIEAGLSIGDEVYQIYGTMRSGPFVEPSERAVVLSEGAPLYEGNQVYHSAHEISATSMFGDNKVLNDCDLVKESKVHEQVIDRRKR